MSMQKSAEIIDIREYKDRKKKEAEQVADLEFAVVLQFIEAFIDQQIALENQPPKDEE